MPKSSVLPSKVVIEVSDDESKGLVASIATTYAGPSKAGPSTPRAAVVPDTSGDWEMAQWLFIDLIREAIDIPGDGGFIDLVSNEEDYREPSTSEAKEGTAPGDDMEEGTVADDEQPE